MINWILDTAAGYEFENLISSSHTCTPFYFSYNFFLSVWSSGFPGPGIKYTDAPFFRQVCLSYRIQIRPHFR